jgi:DNA mismatch endonuclease (patch repair protein)
MHRLGLRFRIHRSLRPIARTQPDIVFPTECVAVFVNGCFWHGCPIHQTWPRANANFWRTKIEGNVSRDAMVDRELVAAGWAAVRIWEHEDVTAAALRVQEIVVTRRSR